jgi:hypothetical protein
MLFPDCINVFGQIFPAGRQTTAAAVGGEGSQGASGHRHAGKQLTVSTQFKLSFEKVHRVIGRVAFARGTSGK